MATCEGAISYNVWKGYALRDNHDGIRAYVMSSTSSNTEMKNAGEAELSARNEQLDTALSKLRALLSPAEKRALDDLQVCWEEFRAAYGKYARAEFERGTNAALAQVTALIAQTDRRIEDVNEELCRRGELQ